MMQNRVLVVALVAGLAAPAFAQDSVSVAGGLPGDALNPTASASQVTRYVVDLAPVATSWGTTFGVAPIVKTSFSGSTFFNSLASAQAISPDVIGGVNASQFQFAAPMAGQSGWGVNPTANAAGMMVSGPSAAAQFAAAVSEFGTTNGGQSYNGMVGAIVNYDPNAANRLYVTRVQGAVNTNNLAQNLSQFGLGQVDANGNLYFRADAFGTSSAGGFTALSGVNIFRTNLDARATGTLNVITNSLTSANATEWIVRNSGTAHNPPSMYPQSVTGGNGIYAGPNFATNYVFGADFGATTTTTAHRGARPDHRGSIGVTTANPLGGVGTAAILVKPNATSDPTNTISAWSYTTTGAVGTRVDFFTPLAPLTITDPTTGFVFSPSAAGEYRNYTDQVGFRGGSGQVAVHEDQGGNLMVAATWFDGGFNDDFNNQIFVGRRVGTTTDWTIAAYIDAGANGGKPILDGPGGAAIGRLTPLFNVTGGAPLGPSLSAPAFDSVGNVWFIGGVELFNRIDTDQDTVGDASDFDSALIRAVFNPTTFSYELELVLELGQQIDGLTSGREYRIDFLSIADANSASSGSLFSANASRAAWNNTSVAGLDPADPITNGGVVIAADITYDADQDNDFNDPTSGNNTDATTRDESYQALLYVGYFQEAAPMCPADFNGDTVPGDIFDLFDFLAALDGGLDFNGDTSPADIFDLFDFLAVLDAGCP